MFGNIGQMMKLASELKTKLPELKQRLASSHYRAEAGGGAVAATVDGKLQIVDLTIDRSVLSDKDMDVAMLADLVKAAIAAAQKDAATDAEEAMKELTGGMDLDGMASLLG